MDGMLNKNTSKRYPCSMSMRAVAKAIHPLLPGPANSTKRLRGNHRDMISQETDEAMRSISPKPPPSLVAIVCPNIFCNPFELKIFIFLIRIKFEHDTTHANIMQIYIIFISFSPILCEININFQLVVDFRSWTFVRVFVFVKKKDKLLKIVDFVLEKRD